MTARIAAPLRRIAAAALTVGCATCAATAVPNGVDILSRLKAQRVEHPADSLTESAIIVRPETLLESPESPYSATLDRPPLLNEVDWQGMVDTLPPDMNGRDALDTLHWDLGLSRGRPGIDVPPRAGYRDPLVAASATKADVDADIFWHMLDLVGQAHSARAASFAVALQILREQVAATPPERRIALAVDAEVLERVMLAEHLDQVPSHDLRYLSLLVQYRLAHWHPGGRASTGLRALPVAYRIARVAAAYRDVQGYVVAYPCQPDASFHPRHAGLAADGDDRPLCFAAATDRAVHRWYLDELKRQAFRPASNHHNGLTRLITIAAVLTPLLDLAALIEVTEAAVASELVAGSALEATETESLVMRRLTCPIPE